MKMNFTLLLNIINGAVREMFNKLNYFWRVIATGVCFTLFGFGGLLLSLILFPLQRVFIAAEKQKKVARRTVHFTFKFFIRMMAITGIFDFSLAQAQKLKALNGHLVLANHPSLIDVVVLISILPNADCVVKTHLFKNVFLRGVVKNTGYISNADPEGLLSDCQASLAAGNNLIIFPQGTRTHLGDPIKFQRGAANIAVRCQAKVISVLLSVSPSTLTKSEPWYKVPYKKAHFIAKVIEGTPTVKVIESNAISKEVRQYNLALENYFRGEMKHHE